MYLPYYVCLNHHTTAINEKRHVFVLLLLLHVLFLCYCFVIAAYVVALLRITVAPAQAEQGMFLHVFSPLTVGATFGDPVILK